MRIETTEYDEYIDAVIRNAGPGATVLEISQLVKEVFALDLHSRKWHTHIQERIEKAHSRDEQGSLQELKYGNQVLLELIEQELRPKHVQEFNLDGPSKSHSTSLSTQVAQASPELAEILGAQFLTRTAVMQRLWQYIKDNELQSNEDRRIIICDERLKPILGQQASMFDLTRLLKPHLTSVVTEKEVKIPSSGTVSAEYSDNSEAGDIYWSAEETAVLEQN